MGGRHAHAHGVDDGDLVRGAGAGEEGEDNKMDLLWENFNEELEALHRAAGSACSNASARGGGMMEPWDAESGRGCAAPMLMASSRAGGAEHFRRSGSWVLLMRIFRSLFVVEKTIPAARRRQERSP